MRGSIVLDLELALDCIQVSKAATDACRERRKGPDL